MAHLEAAASERDINLTYELTVSETDGLKVACTMYLDSDVVTGIYVVPILHFKYTCSKIYGPSNF